MLLFCALFVVRQCDCVRKKEKKKQKLEMERAICVVRVRTTARYTRISTARKKCTVAAYTHVIGDGVAVVVVVANEVTPELMANTEDRTTKRAANTYYSEFVGHRKVFPEEWYVYSPLLISVLQQFEVCSLCSTGSQAQIRLIVDIFVHCSILRAAHCVNALNCVPFTPMPILARVLGWLSHTRS